MSLSGSHQPPELAAVSGERPIFESLGLAGDASKPPARPIRPSRPSCSAKPSSPPFAWRLPGLVIDDREAALSQPVDPVGPAVDHDAGRAPSRRRPPPRAGAGPPPGSRAPCSAIQSIASSSRGAHKRAQHRVNGIVLQQPLGPRSQLVGIAIVLLLPFLAAPRERRSPSTRAVWSSSTGSTLRSFRIAWHRKRTDRP